MDSNPTSKLSPLKKTMRIVGEVLSQLLNVPFLSGALLTYVFFQLPTNIPNRLVGFGWALVFLSLIPLASLFFYIPGKIRDWSQVVKRQRTASFVLMIISYPIGYLVLRLIQAPRIYQAIAVNYSLITLGLILFNLVLRYKASGHAAGVAGPVAAMFYFLGLPAAPLATLIPLTIFARIAAKGHDFWQLLTGSLMSAVITLLVLFLYGFAPFSPFQ